jgi:hypothetical protein
LGDGGAISDRVEGVHTALRAERAYELGLDREHRISPVNPNFDRLHESAADEKRARNECATSQPQNENKTTPMPGEAVAE